MAENGTEIDIMGSAATGTSLSSRDIRSTEALTHVLVSPRANLSFLNQRASSSVDATSKTRMVTSSPELSDKTNWHFLLPPPLRLFDPRLTSANPTKSTAKVARRAPLDPSGASAYSLIDVEVISNRTGNFRVRVPQRACLGRSLWRGVRVWYADADKRVPEKSVSPFPAGCWGGGCISRQLDLDLFYTKVSKAADVSCGV
ncbi:hypothetical protein DFS34DRAFT_259030 [Phlyctochytrium arcticum]|nr:hypothetical protein DFS34DRAFT_259030 [Phlyctochytrium arcticum]